MQLTKQKGIALLLIFFGVLILLNKIGFHFGHLIGLLFPVLVIGFGLLGLRNGKRVTGAILIGLGGLILLGKLSGLISFLIAVGLIIYGISMLRKNSVC